MSIRLLLRSLLFVAAFAATGAGAHDHAATAATPTTTTAPATAVRFDGEFAKPVSFDREALAKLPRTTVEANDHGKPGTWQGVAFDELLRQAGAPLGDGLRGGKLASYLVVGATDGYRVVFSLAEFDAAFGATRAILADTRDGKPLDAHEGPFRLIVPDEKRPGRWVRQVERVELRSAAR